MPITISDVLRRAVPVSAVLAALTAGALAPAPAAAGVPDAPSARAATGVQALTLPAPSGGPVGTATLHLVDRSRRDPWTHAGHRELMLSAFYPAKRASSSPARYLTPAFANAFAAGIEVPAAPLRRLRIHAAQGAAARRGRHPVVIVAPGALMPRSSMTLVAEDLAAHGYVALAIDHPGDAAAVQLTRGRIRPVAPSLLAGLAGKAIPKAVRTRRDDVRFLLDRLPGLNRRGRLHGLLDPSRVAMVGHSIGGSSAANVMLADARLDVGVNYDGDYFRAANKQPLRGPFMTMTSITGPTQRAFIARQRGPGMLVNLANAEHESFTDYEFLAPLLEDSRLNVEIGTIEPSEALRTQLAYTHAFLSRHLLGQPASALLTHPTSPQHPAATVEFAAHGGA